MDPFRVVQHCTDLSLQIAFLAHTEQRERGPQGLDKRCWSSKEEENKYKNTGKREAGKKRDVRPILKRLSAPLLRSFRRKLAEKMFG